MIIRYQDIINAQKRRVIRLKESRDIMIRNGVTILEMVNKNIEINERILKILSRHIKDVQADLFEYNAELNQR